MLSQLNHQLYQSTPAEKYATLFLGLYDGLERKLTYSNGGHLPPLILGEDGSVRRLEQGGTVIGLFDRSLVTRNRRSPCGGEKSSWRFSDGVTEPENDFGEFGEQRLIDLVWEHRHQPLARSAKSSTAAVDDWIGANEQPDDITLVLAEEANNGTLDCALGHWPLANPTPAWFAKTRTEQRAHCVFEDGGSTADRPLQASPHDRRPPSPKLRGPAKTTQARPSRSKLAEKISGFGGSEVRRQPGLADQDAKLGKKRNRLRPAWSHSSSPHEPN